MKRIAPWVGLSFCIISIACAPLNPPLKGYDYREGYRFGNCSDRGNLDDLFIVLTFSGGGTRAAAFSYGILKELYETKVTIDGVERRLLDEVDMISSISGGSFTAAYYGLYHDHIFTDFEDTFLKRNVQTDLLIRTLYPWNWFKLLSPYYSRIDLAAKYYDENIFDNQTYENLLKGCRRPFIILNAADLSLGTRFEFTQSQFDLLQSDLSGVSVGRAVASSSAFPGLLTPLTMQNYKKTDYFEPTWVENAINFDLEVSPRRYKRAQEIRTYFDTENRRYIHLIDGGVTDNIGLRGTLYSLMYPDVLISGDQQDVTDSREFSLQRMIADRKIGKLLVVIVDAKPGEDVHMDRSRKTPGLVNVINAVASAPMANYSFETVQLLREYLEQRETLLRNDPDPFQLKTYVIHLRFDSIEDATTRKKFKEFGTNFNLPDEAIDALVQKGGELLRKSPVFQDEFLKDLKQR